MNLLHVVNIYFVIPYFLGEQLIYFKEKGYKEHVICSPSDEIERYSKTHKFDYKEVLINRKISFKEDFKAIKEIRRYIKQNNIDVVIGHTPKGALLSMIAAWLEKVPKRIYFRHGHVFETAKGLKRKLLITVDKLTARLSTKIINVSPSVATTSLKERLNPPEKQIILHKGTCNGIAIHKFNNKIINTSQAINLKKELNIGYDSFVIGYTGRLVTDKGIIELVNAFELLQKSFSNLKLLLIGMFEERDALPAKTIKSIKTNPDIIHVGYKSYDTIEYYYSLMDVFVLLSYREGFPTSILEASAMNLPVITTRATGCVDSIIEKETGFFVGHDTCEIAKAIKFFIDNKEVRFLFGENGRKFVKDNFASEIIWKEIEKLYIE